MKKKELTPRQLCSVLCPTCGAVAGKRCETGVGGIRFFPHKDRKFLAAEAVENEKKINARKNQTVN